jgi:hypothetical protein
MACTKTAWPSVGSLHVWSVCCHFIAVFYFITFYDHSCNREFLALRGKERVRCILKASLMKWRFWNPCDVHRASSKLEAVTCVFLTPCYPPKNDVCKPNAENLNVTYIVQTLLVLLHTHLEKNPMWTPEIDVCFRPHMNTESSFRIL